MPSSIKLNAVDCKLLRGSKVAVTFESLSSPVVALLGWYMAFAVRTDNVPSAAVFVEVVV